MIDQNELNFLRFLACIFPVGLYDGFFLKNTFRKYSLREFAGTFRAFAEKAWADELPRRLSLYIHVPFCAELCHFCHCARTRFVDHQEVAAYISDLDQQLARIFTWLGDIPVQTVYFGGGSPSLLSEKDLAKLLGIVYQRAKLTRDVTVDFEAHPAQMSLAKAKLLAGYSVKRLSLGVQSFDPVVLKAIGRKQSRSQVERAIKVAHKARIRTVNADLVAGLPAQTVDSFCRDVRSLVSLGAQSIHLTPFSDIRSSASGRQMGTREFLLLCRQRDRMIRSGKAIVERAGYKRFGFEAYAKSEEHGCAHEQNHLHYAASVVGVGPFANGILSGYLLYRADPAGERIGRLAYSGCRVDKRYAMAQFMILNMLKGVSSERFRTVFGDSLEAVFSGELRILLDSGVVSKQCGAYRYKGDRSMKSLFEYFALTKILYGEAVLGQVRKFLNGHYRPEHAYSFERDGMLAKMEDHWFLQLYYDVGL